MTQGRIFLPEGSREWTHSVLVQNPVKSKDLKEPAVLVRRIMPDISGPRNEQIISLPGHAAITLFSGAGGLDIGLEQAGFCVVAQHEWDQAACETLIINRPDYFRYAALIQGDIRKTPTSMILSEAGLRVGETHLIGGGPPCQGFSTANPKAVKGVYDVRNDLVFEYLRVIREAQPHFFIFENVPGFTSFNKGEYMEAVLKKAYECYYELVYGLIDACEYGVPQRRCRFILMGTRRDLAECEGVLAGMPNPQNFEKQDLRLIEAVNTPLFQEEYRRMTRAPGIRYFQDRPVLVPPAPLHHGRRTKTFLDFYDRLEREEPDRLVYEPRG